MHYLADASIAKAIDEYSINNIGIPSVVLMERAAQCVADVIINDCGKKRLLAVCGKGNNGGDAIAVARILSDRGYECTIFITPDYDKLSVESRIQINIAENIGINIIHCIGDVDTDDYDIIVDGLFGVGLSKRVSGVYGRIIDIINDSDCKVYSIDVPSGVNCSDGRIMGAAVRADVTVTFGYNKTGLMLYPGRGSAGEVIVAEDVFPQKAYNNIKTAVSYYDTGDIRLMPDRKAVSNKGTYGHVLVIAGSEDMCGAAYLSAKAAYRSGCGLVRVFTHDSNRNVISGRLPEAILSTYRTSEDITDDFIISNIKWADAVVAGPGLGVSDTAGLIISKVLQYNNRPVVIDADAINIIAGHMYDHSYNNDWKKYAILTPHPAEMSRLIDNKYSAGEIHDNILSVTKEFEYDNSVLVLKDAVTLTGDGERTVVNNSGNNGMATAGSGDVLTGIIAAFLAEGLDRFTAASLGVYVHGLAGDMAAEHNNRYSLMAEDIIENLNTVLKEKR